MRYTEMYCDVLWCTAIYWDVLWCTVMYCNILRCTAMYHNDDEIFFSFEIFSVMKYFQPFSYGQETTSKREVWSPQWFKKNWKISMKTMLFKHIDVLWCTAIYWDILRYTEMYCDVLRCTEMSWNIFSHERFVSLEIIFCLETYKSDLLDRIFLHGIFILDLTVCNF